MAPRIVRSSLLALILGAIALPSARATTYVMVEDGALADRSAVIAEVRISAVEAAPAPGRPATDFLVEVERIVKGHVPGSTLVVRVPGGRGGDGIGLQIWGAPRFTEGERALLFLAPKRDGGTFGILDLMLGAFHVREVGGRKIVFRDLSEATELRVAADGKVTTQPGSEPRARDLALFTRWLEDRDRGVTRAADYEVAANDPILGKWTYLLPGDQIPIRWFRFDNNSSVSWRVHESGQSGLGLATTVGAFRSAISAWVDDPGSNIRYSYDGTTPSSRGLSGSDGQSAIHFGDPDEDVTGTFDCGSGGVIAAGGPYFFSATRSFRDIRVHEAVEGDIVTNDGAECFFDSASAAEEVFAHELGHTLGIGHSAERDALMFARAHDDGRGARLTDDDRAAVSFLYGSGAPPPPPPPPGLKKPSPISAQILSSTSVKVTWGDKSTIEENYIVERRQVGGRWRTALTLPANATMGTVTGLRAGKKFEFRVRAKKGDAFGAWSDTIRVGPLPAN
jgi:Matrixin/Fibronectin type III domain